MTLHAGVLRVLVSIIQSEVAWVKDIASEPFHTEVLEHISELQRNDPAVRDALSEVVPFPGSDSEKQKS